jgi:ribosomal subunit interface protein
MSEVLVDIVVKGRHCAVTERFRDHVGDKLSRLEKYDDRIIRIDVVLDKERNPRLSDRTFRVELTLLSRGPVVRAEAAAEDKLSALDLALDRLIAQARKAADRRRVHRGSRGPMSLAQALAGVASNGYSRSDEDPGPAAGAKGTAGPVAIDGDGPLVVREKTHQAEPMTLEQALYEMELVGHDFYLFVDNDSNQPSVVYRRRGYDYGVIRLSV